MEHIRKTHDTALLSEREKHLVGLAEPMTRSCQVCTRNRIEKARHFGISDDELNALVAVTAAVNSGVTGATARVAFGMLAAEKSADRWRRLLTPPRIGKGWGLMHGNRGRAAPAGWAWRGHPFHAANNVNGINADADGDEVTGEVYRLGNEAVMAIQAAYLRKVVDTVNKARAMVAHALDSGRELWRIDWRTFYDCNASTPTVTDDRLFISTGYGGRSARGALFQLSPNPPRQLWLNDDLEAKMSSAVVFEDHVYCVSERLGGQLMCVALRDGAIVWAERKFAPYGTLMIAGGKLVIMDEKGDLVIADATSAGYHERARAKVLNGRCWTMPVLANGRVYARSNQGQMVCLDGRMPPKE